MPYSQHLSVTIEKVRVILEQMIMNAEKQKAGNFQMLYGLQNALNELSTANTQEEKVSSPFLTKWDDIMGWVSRAFEGHPILELIRSIDDEIIS